MNRTTIRRAMLATLGACAFPALADLAISANENKVYTDGGVVKNVANPAADNVAIIDLSASPPRIVAEVKVATSVVGPPLSVAITRDESLALVSAATRIDPADATKTVPHNALSVIDLKANPPVVIATLEAGLGAAGVSINRDGTLALVANRNEGTVSVFTISGKTVTAAGKVKLGDEKSGPCYAAFSPDGKSALVTRDGDNYVSMLSIDGSKVEKVGRDFAAGIRPYGIGIVPDGSAAAVANIGRGLGDVDTVSLIDIAASPPRVVDTVSVGPLPEGLRLSPDGKIAAVTVQDGSTKAKTSPYYTAGGKLVLVRIDGKRLVKVAEAPIGGWSQGIAFSRDGKTILVQNMIEKDIQVFRLEGDRLTDTGQRIKLNGGGAAIQTSW